MATVAAAGEVDAIDEVDAVLVAAAAAADVQLLLSLLVLLDYWNIVLTVEVAEVLLSLKYLAAEDSPGCMREKLTGYYYYQSSSLYSRSYRLI